MTIYDISQVAPIFLNNLQSIYPKDHISLMRANKYYKNYFLWTEIVYSLKKYTNHNKKILQYLKYWIKRRYSHIESSIKILIWNAQRISDMS